MTDDITADRPFNARRTVANTIGHITTIEHRLYIALTGSISCLTTIRSPQAPRQEGSRTTSTDPLCDTWQQADQRTTTALTRLHQLTPNTNPPPPAAKTRLAARWARTSCGRLHTTVNDLHNTWWNTQDHLRLPWVIALRNLEDDTRALRNMLDWTQAAMPAPPANLNRDLRRCGDPLDRGCTRVLTDTRRDCGACRTAATRHRRTA